MHQPSLALHVVTIGVSLAIAGADAALHPPPPPAPEAQPRPRPYERLRLVGPPLPADHPRYGPDVERREGWLDTPPGARAPLPVTCWLREGRLVELASRGTEPISAADVALFLSPAQLGRLPPEAAVDLDWIWAELGLAERLDADVELHFVATQASRDELPRPAALSGSRLVPALLVRLTRRGERELSQTYSLFSLDGRDHTLLGCALGVACGGSARASPSSAGTQDLEAE